MLIHAHSLFGVPLGRSRVRVPIGDPRVWGSHWGCSWDRGPIGDPRVWGSHWAAPGQGLGDPWPFGTPLGHPPRPPGLGFPLGRSWVCVVRFHDGNPGSGSNRFGSDRFPVNRSPVSGSGLLRFTGFLIVYRFN